MQRKGSFFSFIFCLTYTWIKTFLHRAADMWRQIMFYSNSGCCSPSKPVSWWIFMHPLPVCLNFEGIQQQISHFSFPRSFLNRLNCLKYVLWNSALRNWSVSVFLERLNLRGESSFSVSLVNPSFYIFKKRVNYFRVCSFFCCFFSNIGITNNLNFQNFDGSFHRNCTSTLMTHARRRRLVRTVKNEETVRNCQQCNQEISQNQTVYIIDAKILSYWRKHSFRNKNGEADLSAGMFWTLFWKDSWKFQAGFLWLSSQRWPSFHSGEAGVLSPITLECCFSALNHSSDSEWTRFFFFLNIPFKRTDSLLKTIKKYCCLSFWCVLWQKHSNLRFVSDVQSWIVKSCEACEVIKEKCGHGLFHTCDPKLLWYKRHSFLLSWSEPLHAKCRWFVARHLI